MRVYAVFRRRRWDWAEWHVYKLFSTRKLARAYKDKRGVNSLRQYEYAVQSIKVEQQSPCSSTS